MLNWESLPGCLPVLHQSVRCRRRGTTSFSASALGMRRSCSSARDREKTRTCRASRLSARLESFLTKMLSIIDLGRENCYITNIVKCRPPKTATRCRPSRMRVSASCARRQADQPKIIVCLGRIAAMRLIRPDFKISREHGQFTEKGGILFTALYHPSALLRDESKTPGHLF